MKYTDLVYGEFEITQPVILDLINSKAIQRLKGIEQSGYFAPFFKIRTFTRFDHSMGVYLLLKQYGAPLEEQIAGLIHDVSHMAFSHCVDYVFDEKNQKTQSYQDDTFEEFVKKSDIPQILAKHKVDLNYILNEHNFPLKENNLPDLCADRIDYSLRTLLYYNPPMNANVEDLVKYTLKHLKVIDKSWVFDDFESAWNYAEMFLQLNTLYFSGIEMAAMQRAVGDCLIYALDKKYIAKEDLYQMDSLVLSKIMANLTDPQLRLLFARMNNKMKYTDNPTDYASIVYVKSRVVDPLFTEQGNIYRFSDKYAAWKEILAKESTPKEYFLKFVD